MGRGLRLFDTSGHTTTLGMVGNSASDSGELSPTGFAWPESAIGRWQNREARRLLVGGHVDRGGHQRRPHLRRPTRENL